MTTTINLPAVIEKQIKPKPTKREMIEALAIRHHAKAVKEWQETKAKGEAFQLEVAAEVHELLKTQLASGLIKMDTRPCLNKFGSGPRIRVGFDITVVPQRLLRKMQEVSNHHCIRQPELSESRKYIQAEINGITLTDGSRVDAMLKDEGMVKALDGMLKKLEKGVEKPEAVATV